MMTEQLATIVDKLLSEELPEGFLKEKNQLLNKLMQEPSGEAVKAYSVRKNINLKEARERLEANYQKEIEEVQFKEVALRLSNAMKILSPKMMGLEQREIGREEKVKEAVRKSEIAIAKVDDVIKECLKLIYSAKTDIVKDATIEVAKGLHLDTVIRNIMDTSLETESLRMQIDSLKQEIEQMKQNTLKNKIKKFFGVR